MKFVRMTVNVPPDLAEAIRQRIPECPYASDSAYFLGLAIFDLWSRREHRYTARLMAQPPTVRDAAIAELVAQFKTGKPAKSDPGWFDHFVQRVIEAEREKATQAAKPQAKRKARPRAAKRAR